MASSVTGDKVTYTNLHVSTLTFSHPPNPPDHLNQCQRQAQPGQQQKRDHNKHIRVYHNEPSGYAYNSSCFLIKESRYSTLKGWHAPSDDLVADDAGVGSPVVGVGWWTEGGKVDEEVWEVSLLIPPLRDTLSNCN